MTLTELKYIVMLAEEKHFGRAADRCYVSQPTLSVAVKKLEEELGTAIFERSKSSVYITPVGEQIITQAKRVLDQANMIKELANAGKNQLTGPLKVGAIYTIAPYLFPVMIPSLSQITSGMPLIIEEDLTENLRPKLRNGDLDAIIVALPFQEPDVVTQPIYEEEFVVLMPKNHPWTQLDNINTDQLSTDNLLLLGKGHCFSEQVLEAEAIWAVFHQGKPFNLKSQNTLTNYPGPKYKKTSFSNPGHAHNLAKKLNFEYETHSCGGSSNDEIFNNFCHDTCNDKL